jgi:hypothetical protein
MIEFEFVIALEVTTGLGSNSSFLSVKESSFSDLFSFKFCREFEVATSISALSRFY